MARFDDVAASFWGEGPYGVLEPLTTEAVEDAEKTLGVTLPLELVELLRRQNGGPVADEWSACPTDVPTSWSPDHVAFDHVFGIGPGIAGRAGSKDLRITLLDSPYLIEEWGLPSSVVLVSGGAHCWIGLDYRTCGSSGSPSVVWLDDEFKTEVTLADSFRSFVERLASQWDFAD
jgi:hypothetical protein